LAAHLEPCFNSLGLAVYELGLNVCSGELALIIYHEQTCEWQQQQ
jgi:hypothetical protein